MRARAQQPSVANDEPIIPLMQRPAKPSKHVPIQSTPFTSAATSTTVWGSTTSLTSTCSRSRARARSRTSPRMTLRQGLKMDPEHKKCKEMFRLLKKIGNLRKAADAATASCTAAIGKDAALQAWDDLTSADASSVRLQAARAFGKCQVFLKTHEWHSVIKHCNEGACAPRLNPEPLTMPGSRQLR